MQNKTNQKKRLPVALFGCCPKKYNVLSKHVYSVSNTDLLPNINPRASNISSNANANANANVNATGNRISPRASSAMNSKPNISLQISNSYQIAQSKHNHTNTIEFDAVARSRSSSLQQLKTTSNNQKLQQIPLIINKTSIFCFCFCFCTF